MYWKVVQLLPSLLLRRTLYTDTQQIFIAPPPQKLLLSWQIIFQQYSVYYARIAWCSNLCLPSHTCSSWSVSATSHSPCFAASFSWYTEKSGVFTLRLGGMKSFWPGPGKDEVIGVSCPREERRERFVVIKL